ncbi:hypothetical protein [Truepera radiovictrix]|uniref:OstA-like protein protein n=1 Tax=Truepera radiovictrix (strain DSM 17093 / CIP 108686 / LMG 22925 / RQ-24) TaxID=649638 RepID=D7CW98_TRURR|nr:hypothetical protein [Truepera radiovictrix]ADI16048.1 OstA-like protein protein [Truepera radiovictrix DSM 17093]WMT58324.1 hypothetical protein RCV51_05125 [Truepera radiovictrix]
MRPPRRFAPAAVGLALSGALVSAAPGGAAPLDANLPSFELRRGDRTIVVQQTATDAEGGIAIPRGGNCRDGFDLSFYYAPEPKLIETTVGELRISSRVVLREQPRSERTTEGGDAQDEAVLDFFGGSLELNPETLCPDNLVRNPEDRVTLREGRTTVQGGALRYDNASGIGEMRGPIALERRAAGEAPALQASSNALLFNVDDELQTLRGGVRVEAEGRVSEADELELDEQAGVAVLRGSPARSRDAEGEVSGEVLVYDLESNDVVVRGSVRATLTLEDGVGGAGAVAPAAEGAGEAGE